MSGVFPLLNSKDEEIKCSGSQFASTSNKERWLLENHQQEKAA
jgi:hypothetical protein